MDQGAPYVTRSVVGTGDFVQTDPAGTWFTDAFCMVHCEGTVWAETN
jgi:hypothetical protein